MDVADLMALVDLEAGKGLEEEVNSLEEISEGEFNPDDFDLEDTFDDEDEEVLQEVNIGSAYFETFAGPKEFPYLLVRGINTEEEFKFYQNMTVLESEVSVPVYTEVEGVPVQVMTTDLSLQFFLNLHFIADYDVFLWTSETESIRIDLNNPNQLIKFIKL